MAKMTKLRKNNLQRVKRLFKRLEDRGFIIPEDMKDLSSKTTQQLQRITEARILRLGTYMIGKTEVEGWEGVVHEMRLKKLVSKINKYRKAYGEPRLKTIKEAVDLVKYNLETTLAEVAPIGSSLHAMLDYYKDEIGEEMLMLRLATSDIALPALEEFMMSSADPEAIYSGYNKVMREWYTQMGEYLSSGKADPKFAEYHKKMLMEFGDKSKAEADDILDIYDSYFM